jgi:hypothetical protein
MKKTNKPNPLKVFNDNKAMAYKKAGGEMAAFKKSLKKAQDGTEMGNDMMINKPGSTGGYQKSSNPIIPPAGTRSAYGAYPNPKDIQSKAAIQTADILSSAYKQKRGGSIKSKKK